MVTDTAIACRLDCVHVTQKTGLSPCAQPHARAPPACVATTMLSARHSLAGAQLQCGAAPRLRRSSAATRSASVAKLTKDGPHVAIVGTTGAVGQEFLNVRACVGGASCRRLAAHGCCVGAAASPARARVAACACF